MKTLAPALAAGIALGLPLSAAAAPPWSPVEKVPQLGALSGGQGTAVPAVDVDASGNSAVVWVERRGVVNSIVVGAYRTAAGKWTRKVLSKPGLIRNPPVVATTNTGQAVFSWDRTVRRGGRVRGAAVEYAVFHDGAFGPARRASTHRRRAAKPGLVVGGNGAGTLVWLELRSGRREVFAARFDPRSRTFTRRGRVSLPGENAPDPRVHLTSAGGGIVTWKSKGNLRAAVAPRARSRFGAPHTLNPRGTTAAGPYDVARGPRGTALIAWETVTANRRQRRMYTADVRRNGTVSARELLSIEKAGGLARPSVAVNVHGDAVVSWQANRLLPGREKSGLRVSQRRVGKRWAASHLLASDRRQPAATGIDASRAASVVARYWYPGFEVQNGSGRSWSRPLQIPARNWEGYSYPKPPGGDRGVVRRDDGGTSLFWFAETPYGAPEDLRALYTARLSASGIGVTPVQIARVKGKGAVAMSGLAAAAGPRGHQIAVWRARGQLRASLAPPA